MTHSLDFVGLNEKLFLLRHLIAGTKDFCRREQLHQGTRSHQSEEWEYYSARLRHLVSNDLIESAAKLRVIQDTAAPQVSPEYLRELDQECRNDMDLGNVLVGDFALTLRESCNKIIHATNFELVFQNARNTKPSYLYSYWNGICKFGGVHSRRPWQIALDVYRWSDSMDYFLTDLAGNVDW